MVNNGFNNPLADPSIGYKYFMKNLGSEGEKAMDYAPLQPSHCARTDLKQLLHHYSTAKTKSSPHLGITGGKSEPGGDRKKHPTDDPTLRATVFVARPYPAKAISTARVISGIPRGIDAQSRSQSWRSASRSPRSIRALGDCTGAHEPGPPKSLSC